MPQLADRSRCGRSIASVATACSSALSPWRRSTKAPSGTPHPEATLAAFREFLGVYAHLPLTDPIIERFARVRAALRRQGQLIPDMDLFIAATALEADLILVTRNVRHFGRIAELKLYQPS